MHRIHVLFSYLSNCDNGSEDKFCFTSDCRNSFNCKLKKLINARIIIFYSLSDALCSHEKSAEIKHFQYHTFIDMCSILIWLNLQVGIEFLLRNIES